MKAGRLVLLSLFGLTTGRALGQDVTGVLRGRLVSTDHQPVISADVVVSGPGLQQAMPAHSDSRGEFVFLALPVGPYTLRIRAIGFRPVLYEQVIIGLGRTTSLDVIALEPASLILPDLVVTGRIGPIDLTTASSGTNLQAAALDRLPLDRSLTSIIALAPQASYQPPDLSFRSEGVNIAGGSIWDNAYFVDGVNVTDPGMGASGINLPYNFIQEVQIKTGGYEAEYGRALGGIVNVITPSGGNELHASVFTFYTGDVLRTTPFYGLVQTHLDQFSEFDIGGSLSGPIRKDRLWFFLAYNPLVDVRDASYPGISPQRDRQTQHRFAGKLTWQPVPATRIALTMTGDPTVHDGVAPIADYGAFKAALNPETVLARLNRGGYGAALHADHTSSRGALLAATISHAAYRDDFSPQTAIGAAEPRFTDVVGNASGGYGGDGTSRFGRDAASASLTVPTGRHTYKIGAEYESSTLNQQINEGSGTTGGFIAARPSGGYVWTRSQDTANVAIRVLTAYLQDSWVLSSQVRVNAGLRWEGQWWVGSSATSCNRFPINGHRAWESW